MELLETLCREFPLQESSLRAAISWAAIFLKLCYFACIISAWSGVGGREEGGQLFILGDQQAVVASSQAALLLDSEPLSFH